MCIKCVGFTFSNGTFTHAPAPLLKKWCRKPNEPADMMETYIVEVQRAFNSAVKTLSNPKPNRNKFVTYMNAMLRVNPVFLTAIFKEGQDESDGPVDLPIVVAEHLGIAYNKAGDPIWDRLNYPMGW